MYCAEQASNWTLRAELLTDMTRHAVDRRLLDDATSLIELAQVRADRVAGTGRSMMKCAHARVLGSAGHVTDCQDAISAAEDTGLRDPTTVPAASSTLRAALARPDAISNRRRAMSTVKVATLELLYGDRDEGIALDQQALHLSDGVRSATTRHASGGSVDAIQQQLDSILKSA